MELPGVLYPEGFASIGGGVNSRRFSNGKKVIKISSLGRDEDRARDRFNTFHNEYQMFRRYLGDYVEPSAFDIKCTNTEWLMSIEQNYVEGTPLRKSLYSGSPLVRDFLEKNLVMYQKTGHVPDLFPDIMVDLSGGMYINGKFTYRSTPNVLIVEGRPILIDVTLNKNLRRTSTGPLMRAWVARTIRKLLRTHNP